MKNFRYEVHMFPIFVYKNDKFTWICTAGHLSGHTPPFKKYSIIYNIFISSMNVDLEKLSYSISKCVSS